MVTAGDGADDLAVARCVSDQTVTRSPPDRIAACVQCAPQRERWTAEGRTRRLGDGRGWLVGGVLQNSRPHYAPVMCACR